ncbi:hypothetical protein HK104_010788, partial [Borealophlyctis nickersoniae]
MKGWPKKCRGKWDASGAPTSTTRLLTRKPSSAAAAKGEGEGGGGRGPEGFLGQVTSTPADQLSADEKLARKLSAKLNRAEVRGRKKRRAISPPTHDNYNIDDTDDDNEDDEDKGSDDDFVSPPLPSTSRRKGAIHGSSSNGTKSKKVKKVDNVQPRSTTTTTAEVSDKAHPTSKKPRIASSAQLGTGKKPWVASSKKDTTPKVEKNLSKDSKVQRPRKANKISFDSVDVEGGGGRGAEGFLGGARERYKIATVIMGQRRFLRAAQLAETIENTVKEMTQLMVEGNAVLMRYVLYMLERGDEIRGSNLARQCFAATQRDIDPLRPKTNARSNRDVIDRRNEYADLRPEGLHWADGRFKSDLITAAVKQYNTNVQVYTIYQLIPRLRKLVQVEIFERVPLPTSATKAKKIRAKVLSSVVLCLQGVANYDATLLRDFIEKFVDESYTTFILDAISYVLDDVQRNILNGRTLFVAEKDPVTRQSHPTFIQAKDEFETWIPVHYAILQRYEEYARTPSARRQNRPKLAPFTILPKYSLTPNCIIINTDRALFDLWNLANWQGVERPTDFDAFKAESDLWWRRTFRIEKVQTVRGGNRRFRYAVYMDGVSCRISIKKRILGDGLEGEE